MTTLLIAQGYQRLIKSINIGLSNNNSHKHNKEDIGCSINFKYNGFKAKKRKMLVTIKRKDTAQVKMISDMINISTKRFQTLSAIFEKKFKVTSLKPTTQSQNDLNFCDLINLIFK